MKGGLISLAVDSVLNEKTSLLLPTHSPITSRRCSVASGTHQPVLTSAQSGAKRDKAAPWRWYNDLYFIGPIVLTISLLVGIIFYVTYNGWSLGSSTFCATATLIGSIYGVPNQPDNVGAAFTILYYVYGISLFTAIIGAIVGSMITRAPLISAEARRKIAQMEQPEDTDGDGEIGFCDYFVFLRVRFLDFIGWEEYRTNYLITAAAFAWVALGVLFGMGYEGWGFDQSLYFAMNAVSMAALADPPCDGPSGEHCDVGTFRGLALSVYLLVGVPLFTLALAQFAGMAINKAVRENEYKIINQPLTQDEYSYAANLYGNDEVLSLGEFTVLELLRLQRVSMEDLEQIKNLFCAIDEADSGMVDKPMLAKRNLIHGTAGAAATAATAHYYGSTSAHLSDSEHELFNGATVSASGGGGRGRERSNSNEDSSTQHKQSRSRGGGGGSGRPRSRSRSISSYNNNNTGRNSPPGGMRPVNFDLDDSSVRRNEGGSSVGSGSSRSRGRGGGGSRGGSSVGGIMEVPASIKRMTIGEYNEVVVPLAFTTLIENYEEAPDEDGGGGDRNGDEDDLSSRGFHSGDEDDNGGGGGGGGDDLEWGAGSGTSAGGGAGGASGSGLLNQTIQEGPEEEEREDEGEEGGYGDDEDDDVERGGKLKGRWVDKDKGGKYKRFPSMKVRKSGRRKVRSNSTSNSNSRKDVGSESERSVTRDRRK